jgi:hypothetical protein
MMAAGLGLAAMAGGKKNEAQNLQNQLGVANTGSGGTGSGNGTGTRTASTDTGNADGELSRLRGQLEKQGYKVDANGNFTTPNGTTMNAGNINAAGLQAAGLSPAQSQRFMDDLTKAANKAAAASINAGGSGDGPGGGGSGGSGGAGGVIDGGAVDGVKSNKAEVERSSLDRNPAAWDGFGKKFGDSLVGVSQSDIFLMIEKRVEKESVIKGQELL